MLVALLATAWPAAGAGVALAAGDGTASATTSPAAGTAASSTSTTTPGAPTTTLAPLPGSGTTIPDTTTTTAGSGGSSTTTTGPGAGGTSPAAGGTTGGGSGGGASGGGGTTGNGGGTQGSPTTAGSAPDPRLEAVSASVPRTGASTTRPLLEELAPLSRYGLTQLQTALIGFGHFPVAGPATYTDDWLEYRGGPTPRLHEGIDIDAAEGTPLRSPTDGVLTYSNSDPDGYGLTALITQPDRTTFLMAHMSATVLGLTSGTHVSSGQVVGFVGASGDATGPHLHFEVHPLGGAGIDGKPLLDRWIRDAMAAAPGLIAAFQNASSPAAQPQVAPVPVSVPAPTVHAATGGTPSHGAASLRAPSWAASAAVRVVTMLLVVAAAALGAEALRRRTRAAAAPARSEG